MNEERNPFPFLLPSTIYYPTVYYPTVTMRYLYSLLFMLSGMIPAAGQTFDLTQPQPRYSDATGYGYDVNASPAAKSVSPFYFSVKVPDGNYRITVTLGSNKRASSTVVRAENRRFFLPETPLKKKQLQSFTFVINKRSPFDENGRKIVRIKDREKEYFHWDDRLTLEFNGAAPAVSRITIEKDTTAVTVFLCGNSTVVDQFKEPWASWGQMFPRWFNDKVSVCNLAESGLTATSFVAQGRLDYILKHIRKGDYVFCEFGHNDQKEHGPGDGAWYNYSHVLKKYIDLIRRAGGYIIFCTPTQRRAFDSSHQHIQETHGDYPAAMRAVAQREHVPVIELHDMTRTFFETLGYDNSTKALVHYPANTFPGQDKALADNTHFNPYGAYEVSRMVVMGLRQLQSPLCQYLRTDWHDFDPAHPDDWRAFKWAPSVIFELAKPDGN